MSLKEFKKLSSLEIKFAELILSGVSGLQAAKEVGISEKTACHWAIKKTKESHIIKYIDERKQEIINLNKVDENFVTCGFKSIFNRSMQQVPVMEYDRELKMMVHKVDEETGQGMYTFDSNGAVRAMENLAKHIGYYEKDNDQKRPVINVAIITPNNIYEDEGADTSSEYSHRSIPAVLPPPTEE